MKVNLIIIVNIVMNILNFRFDNMKLNDIDINYKQEGCGKTIIFIHGLSDNLNYWNQLTDTLKNNFEVISYDLRGHGKTTLGNKKITVEILADDLNNLMNALNIKKATLVGLSLGGNVALMQAINNPEKVSSLVIMSSSAEVDEKLALRFKEFYDALDNSYESFYDAIIKYVLPKEILEKNHEKLEMVKKESAKISNVDGIKQCIKGGSHYNISQKIKNIEVPTLILTGADDDITDATLQEKLCKNIKNSKMIIFKNTKHNLLIGKNTLKIIDLISKQVDSLNQ